MGVIRPGKLWSDAGMKSNIGAGRRALLISSILVECGSVVALETGAAPHYALAMTLGLIGLALLILGTYQRRT